MIRRTPRIPGAKAHYVHMPPPPGLLEIENSSGSISYAVDLRVPFEERRKAAFDMIRSADQKAATLRAELRDRLSKSNPVSVYSIVVALERQSRRLPIAEVYGYDAVVEYLGGVVTSLPLESVHAGLQRTATAIDALEIDSLLRDLATAESQAGIADLANDADQRHVDARFLLLQEQQFDRMAGYNQHVRQIARRIFEPLTELSVRTLGTSPLVVLDAAEAHARLQERRQTDALNDVARNANVRQNTSREQHFALQSAGLLAMGDAIRCDLRPTLEVALGLEPSEVNAVLKLLSTPLGSQDVKTLKSPNRLRRFPVIPLPDGTHIWARPYDFLHDALDWFDQVLVAGNHDRLRQRLSAERVRTVEALTTEALGHVFGQARVHAAIEYELPTGDWAETDTLIDVAASQIVVEAKGYRLTDPGRSGDAARVRTKYKQLVTEPLTQSARARSALLHGTQLRVKRTQRPLPDRAPTSVNRCIVTLDRVDPFHAEPQTPFPSSSTDPVDPKDAWIVCLADLLMVTAVLRSPAELFAYIEVRAAQTAAGSPRISMESDALGAWLETREGVWPVEEGAMFMLEYSSEAINTYFTQDEMHTRYPDQVEAPQRPRSGIPDAVLDALTRLLDNEDPRWETAASAVGTVDHSRWRMLNRDFERLQTAPRTRSQRKAREAAKRGRRMSQNLTVLPALEDAIEICPEGLILSIRLA